VQEFTSNINNIKYINNNNKKYINDGKPILVQSRSDVVPKYFGTKFNARTDNYNVQLFVVVLEYVAFTHVIRNV